MGYKLIDQDFIDLSIIKKCLEKNNSLIKGPILYPTLEILSSIKLVNDPSIIYYFKGGLDSIQLLVNLCNEKFIPLFKNDILEVITIDKKIYKIDSEYFINFISDEMARLDDHVISNRYSLDFKISQIYSIKITIPDSIEKKKLSYKMTDLEFDYNEFNKIKNHVISLINREFKTNLSCNDFNNYKNILDKIQLSQSKFLKNDSNPEYEVINRSNNVNLKKLESLLMSFNKTRNILFLVESLLVLGKDEDYSL